MTWLQWDVSCCPYLLEFLEGPLWLFKINSFNVNVSSRNTTLIMLSTAFLFCSKYFLYLFGEYFFGCFCISLVVFYFKTFCTSCFPNIHLWICGMVAARRWIMPVSNRTLCCPHPTIHPIVSSVIVIEAHLGIL